MECITPKRRRQSVCRISIRRIPVEVLIPATENDKVYHPVDPADPDFRALVESIKQYGIKEPLRATSDFVVISGHRRTWSQLRPQDCKQSPSS